MLRRKGRERELMIVLVSKEEEPVIVLSSKHRDKYNECQLLIVLGTEEEKLKLSFKPMWVIQQKT